MHEQNSETSSEPPGERPIMRRRLVDKINAAVLHALDQGRREIAAKLKLLHQAVVEKEIEEGYADRSDDDLEKWLENRFKNGKARQRARTARY